MILHTVLFWLKSDVPAAERSAFAQALAGLPAIGQPTFAFVGKPLGTPVAPVIDASYDHKLVLGFATAEDYAAYEHAPAHQAFIQRFAPNWAKVVVYDAAP